MAKTHTIEPDAKVPEKPRSIAVVYQPHGNLRDFFMNVRDKEILVQGGAGTGKTYCILQLIHALCLRYPGCRVLILRKTLKSLTASALTTFREKVLNPAEPIQFFGGSPAEPASFRYQNGSPNIFGGQGKPDKGVFSQ